MSEAVVPQHYRIPIGRTASGEEVFCSEEWYPYLTQELFDRVGGTYAPNITTLVESVNEAVAALNLAISRLTPPITFSDDDGEDYVRPGPPGKDGKDGVTTVVHIRRTEDEPEPYFLRIA